MDRERSPKHAQILATDLEKNLHRNQIQAWIYPRLTPKSLEEITQKTPKRRRRQTLRKRDQEGKRKME